MCKLIAWTLLALILAACAGLVFWFAPALLAAGRPELALLCWLAPLSATGVVVAAYIWAADSSWSSESSRKRSGEHLSKGAVRCESTTRLGSVG
jgi:membrane protein implicated in regulation of membrane protease activity